MPLAVPVVQAAYFGDPGGETEHYYWVQAMYTWGYSPLSAPALIVTPAALSRNNIVSLKWTPMPGAVSYDVLRTFSDNMDESVTLALKTAELREKRVQEKRAKEKEDRARTFKELKAQRKDLPKEEEQRFQDEEKKIEEDLKLRDEERLANVPKNKDGKALPEIACIVGTTATNYTDCGEALFPYDANDPGPHELAEPAPKNRPSTQPVPPAAVKPEPPVPTPTAPAPKHAPPVLK